MNYFLRDFLNDYSDQLNELEVGSEFDTEIEYEGDLEIYFVKFVFLKKVAGIFGNSAIGIFRNVKKDKENSKCLFEGNFLKFIVKNNLVFFVFLTKS